MSTNLISLTDAQLAFGHHALLFRAGKNIVIDGARRRQAEQVMLDTLTMMTAREAPSTEYLVQVRQQLQAEQVMLDTLTMMTAREAPSTEYLVQVRQQLQAHCYASSTTVIAEKGAKLAIISVST
ncbi:ECF subfamily RNA polymerase sigma-24 subunit [Alcaligenes faecalis subsp. faecalis NCIB 8687]|nr:ECF subfamily RNA polymerase sigma-24 subunit [Alcaligenes faecalis subsp. faecalis NCIB 8687]